MESIVAQREPTESRTQTVVIPDLATYRPAWGPLGETVFKRSYARDLDDHGTQETWAQTVVRAVDGNLGLVEAKYHEDFEREKLINLLLPFDGLPAGRHLSASGVKGRQFVMNCLSGDTMVQTRQGLIMIRDLADLGHEVEVLSMSERTPTGVNCWKTPSIGVYRKASFKSYGKQKLYEVVFSDGSKTRATADHKWYVSKRSGPVETSKLLGHDVPFVAPPKPERNEKYEIGVLHGFVFGDGSVNVRGYKTFSAYVQMHAEKDLDLVPLFEKHGYKVQKPHYCSAYVGQLPSEWKDLPPPDASNSYWLGFINGLLAADGTVDKGGSVYIYQADPGLLTSLAKKAQEVGFVTSPLYLQREKNPWTGEPAACWRLGLRRFSVVEEDLMLQHHRTNFVEAGPSVASSTKVIAVNDLGIEEEVYCAIEPETHTFVIGNNILTGNCHAAGWDPQEPEAHFSFLFDELMQGGGVGSNYSNRYLDKMPAFVKNVSVHVTCSDAHPNFDDFKHLLSLPESVTAPKNYDVDENLEVVEVEDSREGWLDSLDHVLKAAWDRTPYTTIVLDVSKIRKKGQRLKTSGGRSPGPKPLVALLHEVNKITTSIAGRRLNWSLAMQMDHLIAAAVVNGGKRRSSRMSVKSWKDADIFEFIEYKAVEGANWSTNISVEIDDDFIHAFESNDQRAHQILEAIVRGKQRNGEPGIWNRSLSQQGERDPESMFCPNPCGEIGLHEWESCNLGHINLQHFAGKPLRHAIEAFRLMTRWLIRATFSDIPQARQRVVTDKNRRIGVGFFGFHGWLVLSGVKYSDCWKDEFVQIALRKFRDAVDHEAEAYSAQLGIPVPVKTTTVAPTGSVALLPGVTTGLQPIFSPWFKRRVRYSDTDPELARLLAAGYPHYPDSDAKDTEIVEFWCEDELASVVRGRGMDPSELLEGQDEIDFCDYLEVQAMVQDIYANNAISFTINIPETKMPNESEMVTALGKVLYRLKGTTVFPDKSRKNAPYERITKVEFDAYTGPKENSQVEDECKTGCPVDTKSALM